MGESTKKHQKTQFHIGVPNLEGPPQHAAHIHFRCPWAQESIGSSIDGACSCGSSFGNFGGSQIDVKPTLRGMCIGNLGHGEAWILSTMYQILPSGWVCGTNKPKLCKVGRSRYGVRVSLSLSSSFLPKHFGRSPPSSSYSEAKAWSRIGSFDRTDGGDRWPSTGSLWAKKGSLSKSMAHLVRKMNALDFFYRLKDTKRLCLILKQHQNPKQSWV